MLLDPKLQNLDAEATKSVNFFTFWGKKWGQNCLFILALTSAVLSHYSSSPHEDPFSAVLSRPYLEFKASGGPWGRGVGKYVRSSWWEVEEKVFAHLWSQCFDMAMKPTITQTTFHLLWEIFGNSCFFRYVRYIFKSNPQNCAFCIAACSNSISHQRLRMNQSCRLTPFRRLAAPLASNGIPNKAEKLVDGEFAVAESVVA